MRCFSEWSGEAWLVAGYLVVLVVVMVFALLVSFFYAF
jgi:hypothetical protein